MMKFYLYTKRKEKLIQIVMKEDGRKREVLALIPYFGGRYSFEYAIKEERALAVKDFLENQKLESRRRVGAIAQGLSINAPWINVIEKPL